MTELGEIPNEWHIKTINDLIKENIIIDVMDGNHGAIHPKASDYVDIGIPFIMANNLKNGKLDIEDCKFISYEQAKSLRKGFSIEGDVLLTHKGTLGETAIVPKLKYEYIMLTPQVTYYRLSENNVLINRYLKIYFDSKKYQDKLKSFGSQSTRDYVGIIEQRKLSIILPTIEEQEKISSILSKVDEQIDNVEALIKKNKELKKGLMQTLLTKGIGHTKFKKTEIGEIPEEWELKTFKDISKVSQGLQIAIEERYKEFKEGRLPYITIQYINDKSNSDNEYFIENFNESVVCKEEDILMTRTGNTGIVVTNEIGVFHNNFFKVDFRRDLLNKDFLVWFLNTNFMQNLIIRYAGTTTIPDLKHGDFYKLPVVIPSLGEQEKIASILSEVHEKIEEYKNKKQKLEELKKGLIQQLLTGKIRVV